jgi:cytoskeletal protein CcmA (bactofilin family)
MFHHVNNKDKDPYIKSEKLTTDNNNELEYKPSFENYQNAPRTGLNQTAVQDYVGVGEREIASETANQNSEDNYLENEYLHKETETHIKDVKNKEAETMNNAEQKDNNQENNNQQSRVDIPGGNFQQRPGIPAQTARPAYPGAYTGAPQAANTSAYNSGAQNQASDNDNKLVIGSGINLSGEIEACDHLIVQGTVEASLKGAEILDIAEQGAFYGTVEIENANIAGRFEGEITVRGRLTVESTGIIVGSISYKELSIEAGATIDGAISPIGSETPSRKPAPSKAKKVMKSDEAQLPFADKKIAAE